jgi:hypothetical protein
LVPHFILLPEKCTSRDFPPVLWKGEKKNWREGGKEDPSALIFLPLSTQPYKTSPLRILPLEKSPCSVNLEKKLEGAETG